MGEADDLKKNVELFAKLKDEADERIKSTREKAVRIRSEQKAQLARPYKPPP